MSFGQDNPLIDGDISYTKETQLNPAYDGQTVAEKDTRYSVISVRDIQQNDDKVPASPQSNNPPHFDEQHFD